MIEDRELLRRAWPDGHLPMRGIHTLENWTCIRIYGVANRISIWSRDDDDETKQEFIDIVRGATVLDRVEEVRSGGLLPVVDPTDVASWACVKADLAAAMGWDPIPISLVFKYDYEVSVEDNLAVFNFCGAGRWETFRFEQAEAHANDALGLVLARIRVREERGR